MLVILRNRVLGRCTVLQALLTIGTLRGSSVWALARQVCRLAGKIGLHIVAEFAVVSKRTDAPNESAADACFPLFSCFLPMGSMASQHWAS